jgi:hypothetical protein
MPEATDQPAPPLRTWRPMVGWTLGILAALGLAWVVWSAAGRRGRSAPVTPVDTAKRAAVATSLEAFFSGHWGLADPVIFVERGPYAEAVPRRLAGRDVEVISEEALLKRCAGRDCAPCLTRISVYEVKGDPKVSFCVQVSMSGVWAKGCSFKSIPLGGGRIYEFSLAMGKPVLGRTHVVTF